MNVNELRGKYSVFYYNSYRISEEENVIKIEFEFEIPGLSKFNPKVEILKKKFKFKDINSNIVKNIVFNMGMIEAISYFKLTCSPEVVIKCGSLDEFQEKWYKKLFYLGLGEFRFINKIDIKEDEFVRFTSEGEKIEVNSEDAGTGIIIPIGGGKDSNVTLELLKDYRNDSYAFCIGGKSVSLECARLAGFDNDRVIEVKRTIDKRLIELNSQGYLNGHTPFSAIVAIISYLCAYLLGQKYITLSNESSANESNVEGEKINHQYSKTFEFENDFRELAEKELKANIEYFSLLRPISELQIAMLFSKLEKYHQVFKSCNVGSKVEPWKWCCNCPKCLFVFTILSPFLYKEKLINIFGEDLFEREDLLETFIELCGYGDTKPFECVGTYSEIKYAITKTIMQIEKENASMPVLLKYYKEHFELSKEEMLNYYNKENNLPEEFDNILRKEIGVE